MPLLRRVLAQRVGERSSLIEVGRANSLAVHVGDEHHVAIAGHQFRTLDGQVGEAEPIRRHQHCRPLAGHFLVINKHTFGCELAHGIRDDFGLHAFSSVAYGDCSANDARRHPRIADLRRNGVLRCATLGVGIK